MTAASLVWELSHPASSSFRLTLTPVGRDHHGNCPGQPQTSSKPGPYCSGVLVLNHDSCFLKRTLLRHSQYSHRSAGAKISKLKHHHSRQVQGWNGLAVCLGIQQARRERVHGPCHLSSHLSETLASTLSNRSMVTYCHGMSANRGRSSWPVNAAAGDAAAAELSAFPPRDLFNASDAEALLSVPGSPQLQRQGSKKRLVAGIDQTELVDPWVIADADSRFAEFRDLRIHYKRADPVPLDEESAAGELSSTAQKLEVPAVLLHGFGASVFSWERVLSPLANLLGAPAIAFDRPAFGLTSRVKPSQMKTANGTVVNPYTFGFSAAASMAFVDLMKARKAILIAHSAGAIVAANAFLHAPDRVAAMVLIGPALAAPILRLNSRERDKDKGRPQEREREKDKGRPAEERVVERGNFLATVIFAMVAAVTWFFAYIAAAFQTLKRAAEALQQRFFAALLRSPAFLWLIRTAMDKYGQWAVRFAWFDKEGPSKHVLDGYTKPLRCKDWDKALAEFVLAVAASDSNQPPLTQRLDEITCPVLVVTGDTDRLVPAWNAKRLAKQLPNAKFHVIKNCGHLPQEERPDELLRVIEEFIYEELLEGGHGCANGA